ncbi:MAG TPA: isoprenylcysteine carboxylmethyltransferase family protein [Clostridia bacterium]|nr:isoprenylcysteine carboxylmethyltransferase family protein [Clostridia bacterium]
MDLFTYSTKWIEIIGASILVLSTAMAIWSRIALGKMWTGDASIKENHRLHTEGPYSITRHPIYTGILGMVLGTVLMKGFGLGVFLYFFGMFILLEIKIYDEERLLIETFGEEYHNYKRYVPQIIPNLNSFRKHI